jgi:hypothetical protein
MRKIKLLLAVFTLTAAGLASASSTCTVSQQCPGGGSVQCTGPAGTCTTGSNYVQCNGVKNFCPPPPSSCSAFVQCAYGGFISCNGQGYCEEGADYVYCQGAGTLTCDECIPHIICSI